MPSWLLRAYEEAIPKLVARESLLATNIASIGAGNMKKADRTRVISSWRREANRGLSPKKLGIKAVAAKFGFAVIEERMSDV